MIIEKKYLVLPINNRTVMKKLEFYDGNNLVFDVDVRLDFISPDYEAYLEMTPFIGQNLLVVCEQLSLPDCKKITLKQTDSIPAGDKEQEKYRPFVHFTAQRGWINDPNGLVYTNGEYHLFYQHNPGGTNWGNMHWGHAVSKDLFHWEHKPCALYPDKYGTEYSGCAIIDKDNIAGFKKNANDVMLVYYTCAPWNNKLATLKAPGQCLAYSTDNGETLVKYNDGAPIIPNILAANRDPKVIYCDELGKYVMALYLDGNEYCIMTSENLLNWDMLQRFNIDDTECPDFFPLPVEGESPDEPRKWVYIGAAGRYVVGVFNDGIFDIKQWNKPTHYGHNCYAAQSYSNIPDGRVIRFAWNTASAPNANFNCSMGTPCEMTMVKRNGEYIVLINPIKEIASIREDFYCASDINISSDKKLITHLDYACFDIIIEGIFDGKSVVTVSVFGMDVVCDMANNKLTFDDCSCPLSSDGKTFNLRLIPEKNSIEIYAHDGEFTLVRERIADYNMCDLSISASGDYVIDNINVGKLAL